MDNLGVKAFLAIVQAGSLSGAAELLHLSQGAVSYRLKMLEREVGNRLVERGKGVPRIRLTSTGERFVALAERWDSLQQETRVLQALGPQLSLSISAADSLNIYVLPPLLRALGRHTPPIRLRIRTQHTNESLESVERKEADVAFVVRELASSSAIIEPFFTEEMVLLRLKNRQRAPLETVDLISLQPQHELYMNWSTGYQSWHDKWWDPACPSRIHLDTAGLISTLLQEDSQWAIVPVSVGTVLAEAGRFVVQRLSEPAPRRVCYKLIHKFPGESAQAGLTILDQYLASIYK
ncbi:MAG: LysR family transcriptional regulator [Negativicutes bacterium]|nr:LysR family transcriptional regulator [Negativicutes bacterium]